MDAKGGEEFPRRIQSGRRVVVATHHHPLSKGRVLEAVEESIVMSLGLGRWCRKVENITGHDEHIDALSLDGFGQPGKEHLVVLVPRGLIQRNTQVPIGGMEDAHKNSFQDSTLIFIGAGSKLVT
jgi:hypothetical protein